MRRVAGPRPTAPELDGCQVSVSLVLGQLCALETQEVQQSVPGLSGASCCLLTAGRTGCRDSAHPLTR